MPKQRNFGLDPGMRCQAAADYPAVPRAKPNGRTARPAPVSPLPPDPPELMYLVAIAWLYVALMMAVAEAVHSQGSLLGAVITFLLYGLGPVSLMMYLLGTPARRSARRRAEAAQAAAQQAREGEPASTPLDPDGSRHASAAAEPRPVAPVREEP